MPFNARDLHLERVNLDVAYDAAFAFWNLRDVLAERWGHGPIFGAIGEAGMQQVNLTPQAEEGVDTRLQAVYGLKASGFLAEGEERTAGARELAEQWFEDVYAVLTPRKTVRMNAQLFGLYPVRDPEQVSRRLRGHFYRNDNLLPVLPERLRDRQDSLHSAINWISVDGERQQSLIAGIVGPVHAGAFFTFPNTDRDQNWWMGVNVILSRINAEEGIDQPVESLRELTADAYADYDSIAPDVLRQVIP